MKKIEYSIEIQASLTDVWAVLSDVSRWPSWTRTMSNVQILSGLPLRVGSQVRVIQPKLRPAIWTVVEWKPGTSFAWSTASFGLKIHADHQLEASPSGCIATQSIVFQGLLASLMAKLYGKLSQEYLRAELEGLRRRSESPI